MHRVTVPLLGPVTALRKVSIGFGTWSRVLALVLGWMGLAQVLHGAEVAPSGSRPPNVVLIFPDDLGYGDLGCYGAQGIRTPHLDRLASQGVRFTSFCVAQAVCSASRAAIMTGCLPNRIGILGALGPRSTSALNPDETTLAELLRERGYATAIIGKWHLGQTPEFFPTRHGFGSWYGLPYSNDMWPNHPTNGKDYPALPLMENERVLEVMPDQTRLTTDYTRRAVAFIEANRSRPFFLYLPHSMPHVPLHVSRERAGKSARGLFGDVIQEIDWSVGQITATLKRLGLERDTLVLFTSDNGPWLPYGNHAGTAGPLRAGKGSTFEGGVRVPAIMSWPGRIPAGRVCSEFAATVDVLPTVARLAGAPLPARIIDGRDIWPLMSGQPGARTPHAYYPYYWNTHLQAIRSGPWKLHFPHDYPLPNPPGADAKPGPVAARSIGLSLFNLESDPGETTDVLAKHPDVVQRLNALAGRVREDLGDSATQTVGRNVRPAGKVTLPAG
jgi:arylsulfatase A-like enzyme